jgi:hypothetical protein
MSWHYSQALEAAYSEANSSGGEPSAPSKSTTTPAVCSAPDKTTDRSRRFRSGTIYAPSTENRGVGWWTSSLAASRAKISASQEPAKDSPESAADSGAKCGESWGKYDPASCSWKTAQLSLFGGSESCSETWPRWGMMRNGECWELSMPAHLIEERESGLWPTPTCGGGGQIQPEGTTPTGKTPSGRKQTVCLERYANQVARGLATAVRQWPTPTAQDAKNNGAPSQMERNTKPLNAEVGGPLNPTWVEWLMGWPLGWTDCAASATDKYQAWCASHGVFFHRSQTPDVR